MRIDAQYFKAYRHQLGFSNQNAMKSFFSAKDITPTVDYQYISLLNDRLVEIVKKIQDLVVKDIKVEDIDHFCNSYISDVFNKMQKYNIIPQLNNQGRRCEQVYFSWMRGFIISSYFLKALQQIFNVNTDNIAIIGDDDITNIETFKRTPKADLQINLPHDEKLRIEMQSGFQGINDIKQHKVLEAKKIYKQDNISSIVIHFDLFNGQVAFVKVDKIDDNNINWITRQQMEGQTVFNIDQNYFIWKLTQKPPQYSMLCL